MSRTPVSAHCVLLILLVAVTPFAAQAQATVSGPALPQSTAGQAAAGDALPPGAASSPAVELARLNTEGALLDAKLHNARLQAEITRLSQPQLSGTLPGGPLPTGSPGDKTAPAIDDMRALSVSAYDGRFEARLHIGGQDIPVRQGDRVGDGWTVAHIDEGGVTLMRGRERRVLRV